MSMLILPVRADLSAYEFQVDLEGKTYTFTFRFNQRMGRWIMDVQDEQAQPLAMGIPMFIKQNLVGRFFTRVPGLPSGVLACIDFSNADKSPDENTFGGDVKLVYEETGTA